MPLKFIDLFAGLGGFHVALRRFGFECVFASEIDPALREIYIKNFPDVKDKVFGDITKYKDKVPSHDILCAGFPCQPFSKSGAQKGQDESRGTLFHEIIDILKLHEPEYVFLENVGNFERHDSGRTWKIVRENLETLGYEVKGTEHITSGGTGLLSPHHFGHPHSRERFFIVGRRTKRGNLPHHPFPKPNKGLQTSLTDIVQNACELTDQDNAETKLTDSQIHCIEHWNTFISSFPEDIPLPSFPLWGDEINARYPFENSTPFKSNTRTLRASLNGQITDPDITRDEMLALFPSYARTKEIRFPKWKIQFIRRNRQWFVKHRERFSNEWVKTLQTFPASLRKLEWNCQGEERDLWKHVLQFRPSGLRVKRYATAPALVAMTTTQVPILGPERRFLTRREGLRLQGLPDDFQLPISRESTYRALGNAVHVDVVTEIVKKFIIEAQEEAENIRVISESNTHLLQADADRQLSFFTPYETAVHAYEG